MMEDTGDAAPDAARTSGAADSGMAPGAVGRPAADASGHQDRSRPLLTGPMRLLLALACLTIVIYGMHYASGVLNPILMALFIVMAVSPMIKWMRRRGVPGWLCLGIMLFLVIVVGLLFLLILAVSLNQIQDNLPEYGDKLGDILTSIETWLNSKGLDAGGLLDDFLSAELLAGIATGTINAIFGAFSNVLLMFLIVLFMVSEVFEFPQRLRERFGSESRFAQATSAFSQDTRSYLFIKTWLSALAAVVVTAVYYVFGVDFALLWGMVFFLLSYIPNIGFVISVIPPFVVTLIEQGFWWALIVVVVVIVINAIVDNAVAPKIMGRGLGLTPLAVFLSLVVWAWVLGPVGALISVPLTIMVKRLFLESFEETAFIAEALSSGKIVRKVRERRAKRPA